MEIHYKLEIFASPVIAEAMLIPMSQTGVIIKLVNAYNVLAILEVGIVTNVCQVSMGIHCQDNAKVITVSLYPIILIK